MAPFLRGWMHYLGTVGWDLGRFGIQFVASPRHADGLLITGPVPENMRLALLKTYEAVPAPKLVLVLCACAISGGPYRDHEVYLLDSRRKAMGRRVLELAGKAHMSADAGSILDEGRRDDWA